MFAAIMLCGTFVLPSAASDDYPHRGLAPNALVLDDWGFYSATCTSFVAWRLINDNGVAFGNNYGGVHWGNADHWDDAARALGIRVDDVPAVGAIAQTDFGTALGHVAWVSAVDGDTVTIEEYNYGFASVNGRGGSRRYNTRVVPASDFCYIHIRDLGGDVFVGTVERLNRLVPAPEYLDDVACFGRVLTTRRAFGMEK